MFNILSALVDRAKYERIYRKYSLPKTSPENPISSVLRSDGYVLIKGQLDQGLCSALYDALDMHSSAFLHSLKNEEARTFASESISSPGFIFFPNAGVFRCDAVSDIPFKFESISGLTDVFRTYDYSEIFENYLSDKKEYKVRKSLTRYEVAFGIESESIADTWHFDHYMPRMKSFIYLNDVDSTNCPFQYLKGSNRIGSTARKSREYARYKGGHRSGYLSATEFEDIAMEEALTPVKIYPERGDILLVDTRGIHRRTIPKGGTRITLNTFYKIISGP